MHISFKRWTFQCIWSTEFRKALSAKVTVIGIYHKSTLYYKYTSINCIKIYIWTEGNVHQHTVIWSVSFVHQKIQKGHIHQVSMTLSHQEVSLLFQQVLRFPILGIAPWYQSCSARGFSSTGWYHRTWAHIRGKKTVS